MTKPIALRRAGFSLIELMVVVAIIGILATIAVPGYNRFSGKARQAEAKATLSAIYSGEKAFSNEFSSYVSCVNAIGFTPEATKGNYTSGFSAATITTGNGFNFATCVTAYASTGAGVAEGATSAGTVASDGKSYTAQANGIIVPGSATVDIWRINNDRVLSNPQSGL